MTARPVLLPTEEVITERAGGFARLSGMYWPAPRRGPENPDEEQVGAMVYVGEDADGRLVQLPVTFRTSEFDPAHTLAEVKHYELGPMWVTNALGDPFAVTEFIRAILTGGEAADSPPHILRVLETVGSGGLPDLELADVTVRSATAQRSEGTARVDGRVHAFRLRMPRVPRRVTGGSEGHGTAPLHLLGWLPHGQPEKRYVLAELYWLDV